MITKSKRYIYLSFIASITALMAVLNTSCLGDEPDCCEADIETVTLHVANPSSFFFQMTDSTQVVFSTDTAIVFTVRGDADVTSLSPVFTLSPEAVCHLPVAALTTSATGLWNTRSPLRTVTGPAATR